MKKKIKTPFSRTQIIILKWYHKLLILNTFKYINIIPKFSIIEFFLWILSLQHWPTKSSNPVPHSLGFCKTFCARSGNSAALLHRGTKGGFRRIYKRVAGGQYLTVALNGRFEKLSIISSQKGRLVCFETKLLTFFLSIFSPNSSTHLTEREKQAANYSPRCVNFCSLRDCFKVESSSAPLRNVWFRNDLLVAV